MPTCGSSPEQLMDQYHRVKHSRQPFNRCFLQVYWRRSSLPWRPLDKMLVINSIDHWLHDYINNMRIDDRLADVYQTKVLFIHCVFIVSTTSVYMRCDDKATCLCMQCNLLVLQLLAYVMYIHNCILIDSLICLFCRHYKAMWLITSLVFLFRVCVSTRSMTSSFCTWKKSCCFFCLFCCFFDSSNVTNETK